MHTCIFFNMSRRPRRYEYETGKPMTKADWKMIFGLDLKPLHLIYLRCMRDSKKPMTHGELWTKLLAQGLVNRKTEPLSFAQLSEALKRRDTPYRIRAVSSKMRQRNPYWVVKVKPVN